MKRSFICLIIGLFVLNAFSQEDPWIATIDSNGRKAYVDKNGIVQIPFGKYQRLFTDTLINIAFVDEDEQGIIAINRNMETLFYVYIFDNGPDKPNEGLFRIIEGEKIGFANLKGEVVIVPKYEVVKPFANGLAAYCIGCYEELDNIIQEYYYWTGGKWGFINKSGEVLIEPQFDSVYINKDGEYEAIKNHRIIYQVFENGNMIEKK